MSGSVGYICACKLFIVFQMDQARFERLLRMIKFLGGNLYLTVQEIGERMGVTDRSVYRYIDTFKSAGFVVKPIHGSVYKLEKIPDEVPDLNHMMYFTEEEAYLVNQAIDSVAPTNALRKGLRDKLATIYEYSDIASHTDQHSNATHIETLKQAYKHKKKVVLKNYESSSSGSIRDRIVEPFKFTRDFIEVVAFDTEDRRNKTFKINRIGEVVMLNDPWEYERSHKSQYRDLFGMSGNPIDHIVLRLTIRAKNLLLEEYPIAGKYLTRDGSTWILETKISSYLGIGRFCAGLYKEITIIESERFREYMLDYMSGGVQKFCGKVDRADESKEPTAG